MIELRVYLVNHVPCSIWCRTLCEQNWWAIKKKRIKYVSSTRLCWQLPINVIACLAYIGQKCCKYNKHAKSNNCHKHKHSTCKIHNETNSNYIAKSQHNCWDKPQYCKGQDYTINSLDNIINWAVVLLILKIFVVVNGGR